MAQVKILNDESETAIVTGKADIITVCYNGTNYSIMRQNKHNPQGDYIDVCKPLNNYSKAIEAAKNIADGLIIK